MPFCHKEKAPKADALRSQFTFVRWFFESQNVTEIKWLYARLKMCTSAMVSFYTLTVTF